MVIACQKKEEDRPKPIAQSIAQVNSFNTFRIEVNSVDNLKVRYAITKNKPYFVNDTVKAFKIYNIVEPPYNVYPLDIFNYSDTLLVGSYAEINIHNVVLSDKSLIDVSVYLNDKIIKKDRTSHFIFNTKGY